DLAHAVGRASRRCPFLRLCCPAPVARDRPSRPVSFPAPCKIYIFCFDGSYPAANQSGSKKSECCWLVTDNKHQIVSNGATSPLSTGKSSRSAPMTRRLLPIVGLMTVLAAGAATAADVSAL